MRVAFAISSFLVGSVLAASAFTIAVDSMWMRSGEDWMIRPIDTSLFAVDRETRSFVQEATISAPVEVVYAAWSDSSACERIESNREGCDEKAPSVMCVRRVCGIGIACLFSGSRDQDGHPLE